MHYDFEPYDLLIATHNRTNGHEQALREIDQLLSEVSALSQVQAKITSNQARQIQELTNHCSALRDRIEHLTVVLHNLAPDKF